MIKSNFPAVQSPKTWQYFALETYDQLRILDA